MTSYEFIERFNKILVELNKEFEYRIFKYLSFIRTSNNIDVYSLTIYPNNYKEIYYNIINITVKFGNRTFENIDEFLEYFKIHGYYIFYNIFIQKVIKKSLWSNKDIIYNESDIETFIINNIKLDNFNVFFYNLSKKHQEQYKYLINANKFDLI